MKPEPPRHLSEAPCPPGRPRARHPAIAIAIALAWLLLAATPGAWAATQDAGREPEAEAEAEEVPGLIASYSAEGAPGTSVRRLDADLSHHWGLGAPDARLPVDGFVARWEGLILIQAPGPHRFGVRTEGAVRLTVGGRVILEGSGESAPGGAIDLPAGFAPIALESRHRRGEAMVAIDWEGPGFGREPIPARLFYHDPARLPAPDRFEEGRRLADRLGCANCHAVLELPRHPHLGPPLGDAGRAIDGSWLSAWLRDPAKVRPQPRMPGFGSGFSPAEAANLAAFLASLPASAATIRAEVRMALNVADPARGELLFRSVGCLGCHTRGGPSARERSAPDLADLVRKRSRAWVAGFLEHRPKALAPSGHRPDFRLTADDAAHLAAALVADAPAAAAHRTAPLGDAAAGRVLAERARCASCHAIPGLEPRPSDLRLAAGSRPDKGCLADLPAGPLVPRFTLDDDRRGALRAFVAGLPGVASPTGPETFANDTIRRLNCLGCHARDGRGGDELGERVAALLARDPALAGLKGTLTPPNLSAVGDKLRPEYLALAVRGAAPTARPWLSARMPAFAFEPGEAEAIAAAFRSHDRLEDAPEPSSEGPLPDPASIEAAAHLLGQRGFGCLSCHVISGRIPPGGEPETLGPDLALAHRRMSGRYFRRWVANPQRILAGTPMPQFVKPVATSPGTLDDQLATIWRVLGSPRGAEVAAHETRAILRRQGERALVVRDMVLLPSTPGTLYVPRALAIGLKNDHSLVFDTDRLAWRSWWHGGFLSRTKSGRLWEWHPEGEVLRTSREGWPPVAFRDTRGILVAPREVRERFGRFTELVFEGADILLAYQLFAPGGAEVGVEERIHPLANGWERSVAVADVPAGLRPVLLERLPTPSPTWTAGKSKATLLAPGGTATSIRAGDSPEFTIEMTPGPARSYSAVVRLKVGPAY